MRKKILKFNIVQSSVAFLASLYIRLVYVTTRWKHIHFEIPNSYLQKEKSFLTCFWHARLLMLPYAWKTKQYPFYMLISAHKDGRLISKIVRHFGIKTVAGSTKKGGLSALLHMVHLSRQQCTLGITPDGPRGPAFAVSEGTLMAAYLMKTDLIPVTYAVSKKKLLPTWDTFVLPFPFSKGVLLWGQPIPYPLSKKDFSKTAVCLKQALDDLCQEAEKMVQTCC